MTSSRTSELVQLVDKFYHLTPVSETLEYSFWDDRSGRRWDDDGLVEVAEVITGTCRARVRADLRVGTNNPSRRQNASDWAKDVIGRRPADLTKLEGALWVALEYLLENLYYYGTKQMECADGVRQLTLEEVKKQIQETGFGAQLKIA